MMETWSPDQIRALRGDLSRARFAAELGVSPLTVYRWELPTDAKESRRPQRNLRSRLTALRALRDAREAPSEPPTSAPVPPAVIPDGAAALLLQKDQWQEAEELLFEELADLSATDTVQRSIALASMSWIQFAARGDVRGAHANLLPALARVETGQLGEPQAGRVRVMAALTYGSPDRSLFDPGRAAALAVQLGPQTSQSGRAMAVVAQLQAAYHAADAALLGRLLVRNEAILDLALDPSVRAPVDEYRAIGASLRGRPGEAERRLQGALERAEEVPVPPAIVRISGRLALIRLLNAVPPHEVLELIANARDHALQHGVSAGYPELLLGAAEAEALFRIGRFDQALKITRRTQRLSRRIAWPPIDLVLVQTRLEFHCEGVEGVERLVQEWTERWGHLNHPLVQACITYLSALLDMVRGELARAGGGFRAAREQALRAGTAPWLELMCDMQAFACVVYTSDESAVDDALGRAQSSLRRLPSAWGRALVETIQGVHVSLGGRPDEAFAILRGAVETLEFAGDVSETARARRTLAIAAAVLERNDADEMLAATEAELAGLGITIAPTQSRDMIQQLVERNRSRQAKKPRGPQRLVRALARLASRGSTTRIAQQELLWAVRDLLGERDAVLHEALPDGGTSELARLGTGAPSQALELPIDDGCGRHFLLSVQGPLGAEDTGGLRALATAAGMAFEVAALRSFESPPPKDTADGVELDGVIAASDAMRELLRDVARIGGSDATVLVRGESGAGKEVIASAVHRLSSRSDGPLVVFNSATVPKELFEGQLFGYRKGAFTGATQNSKGVIREAEGGTLFLDEIGDLPIDVQAKLLRFLENGEVQPLGAPRPVRVDVRVVAATHRDLRAMVAQGTFREDLFYRLQVVPLTVPALRERRDDILPLARHFLRLGSKGAVPELSAAASARLLEHAWTGNARELRNVLDRSLAFAGGSKRLEADALRFD